MDGFGQRDQSYAACRTPLMAVVAWPAGKHDQEQGDQRARSRARRPRLYEAHCCPLDRMPPVAIVAVRQAEAHVVREIGAEAATQAFAAATKAGAAPPHPPAMQAATAAPAPASAQFRAVLATVEPLG
jgi:hypothetical protein